VQIHIFGNEYGSCPKGGKTTVSQRSIYTEEGAAQLLDAIKFGKKQRARSSKG
jgi:hypothetical protein